MQAFKLFLCVVCIAPCLSRPGGFPDIFGFLKGIRYVPPSELPKFFAPSNDPPAPDGVSKEYVKAEIEKVKADLFAPVKEGYSVPAPSRDHSHAVVEAKEAVTFTDPHGWLQTADSSTKHYLVGTKNMDWAQARNWCRKNNGTLAEVQNSTEHEVLERLLEDREAGQTNLWIGLKRPFARWTGSKELVTWGNWDIQAQSCGAGPIYFTGSGSGIIRVIFSTTYIDKNSLNI